MGEILISDILDNKKADFMYAKASTTEMIHEILKRAQFDIYDKYIDSVEEIDFPVYVITLITNRFNLSDSFFPSEPILSDHYIGRGPIFPSTCLMCGNDNQAELAPMKKLTFSTPKGDGNYENLTCDLKAYLCKKAKIHSLESKQKFRSLDIVVKTIRHSVRWVEKTSLRLAGSQLILLRFVTELRGWEVHVTRYAEKFQFKIMTFSEEVGNKLVALNQHLPTAEVDKKSILDFLKDHWS